MSPNGNEELVRSYEVPERLAGFHVLVRGLGVALLGERADPSGFGVLVLQKRVTDTPRPHLLSVRALCYWLRTTHRHATGAAAADEIERWRIEDGSLLPIVGIPPTGEVVVHYVRPALATVRADGGPVR